MKSTYLHIISKTALISCTCLLLTSCNKFLDERPSKSTSLVVTHVDQLAALFNNFSSFYIESNRTNIYSTDDYGFYQQLYNKMPSTYNMTGVEFATWDTQYLPSDNREAFWSNEYRKIFTANMVLDKVDKVEGTAEEKARLKAEAHFVRAYSYFGLVNTYCLPYTEQTKNEMGLPLKKTVAFNEDMARAPLQQVYELIESDLKEALTLQIPLVQNGRAKHWRANTAAVNGFAARYYLTRNDYTNALKYASAALSEYSTLVDYNKDMRYGRDAVITINPGTPDAKSVTLQYPYGHDNQSDFTDMLGWKEFLYFRMLNHESWWYIPSQELIDLYDHDHDLRYTYHFVEGYSYERGMIKPAYEYPGYVSFYKDRIPSGPTVAEMYLIKAECQARLGALDNAITTVNVLRKARLSAGPWVDLKVGSKEETIQSILKERRRELPFTQRWNDIRRYNNNADPKDDVEISRTFYPYNFSSVETDKPVKVYRLEKTSRRFAAPIPLTEIISSNGKIEQNTY